MAEVVIRVEVPIEVRQKFEIALARVVEEFVRRTEFALAQEITSPSKLSDKQVESLADSLKQRVAKRHSL